MRLINARTLRFEEFFDHDLPPYLILSHTWEDEEVTYHDMIQDHPPVKRGYSKITTTCRLALRENIEYVWVHTCCIDKSSSDELTESINSMFQWYQRAAVCVVYLADLESDVDFCDGIKKCRWTTRGWALQELIAPQDIEFYNCKWQSCGFMSQHTRVISAVTGVPEDLLRNQTHLWDYSIAQRLSWASRRSTTRVEDTAYCLLGILEVNMPLIYGEGKMAFRRLQEEVIKRSNDTTIFAWNPVLPEDDWDGHCSVLASSPLAFRDSGNIAAWPLSNHNPEFTLTNKGIQIYDHFFCIPLANNHSSSAEQRTEYVWLVGQESSDTDVYFGIHFRMVGESLFLRESRTLKTLGYESIKSGPDGGPRTEIARRHLITNVRSFDSATILAFRLGGTEVSLPGWRVERTVPLGFWDDRDLIQFSAPIHYVHALLLEGTVGGQPLRLTVLIKLYEDMHTPLITAADSTPATDYIFRRRPSGDILEWRDLDLDHPEVRLQLSNEVHIRVGDRNFTVTASLPLVEMEVLGNPGISIFSMQLEVEEARLDEASNHLTL